jgi:hypothetical protein
VKIFTGPSPDEFSWPLLCFLSILINLFITGIFAFIGFAYPSSRLLPESYYRITNPEALTSIYNLVGVKYFRMMLLGAFWGKEKNRKRYFNGTKTGIRNFDFQTRQSEFGHVAAFVAIMAISLIILAYGHPIAFAMITLINVVANFYPIVLQRIHRIQIQRITGSLPIENR